MPSSPVTRVACLTGALLAGSSTAVGQAHAATRPEFEPPAVQSIWQDLLEGVDSRDAWLERKEQIRRQFLRLIRDDRKPARPTLDLRVHESMDVEGFYTRRLISYAVEADERAHAYLAVPAKPRRSSFCMEPLRKERNRRPAWWTIQTRPIWITWPGAATW